MRGLAQSLSKFCQNRSQRRVFNLKTFHVWDDQSVKEDYKSHMAAQFHFACRGEHIRGVNIHILDFCLCQIDQYYKTISRKCCLSLNNIFCFSHLFGEELT